MFLSNLPTTAPTPTATPSNTWTGVASGLTSGILDYFNTRERRKLEETYLRQSQTPPASLLAPGQTVTGATSSMLPLLLIGGAALFLLARR